MDFDDVIYVSLLIFNIIFGHFFRQINDTEKKKYISTLVGVLMVFFVSGIHVLHSIICITINALLILYVNKRLCHIYSFTFSFLYLMFFRCTDYFGLSYPPLHTNMVQMILTLKIVGLAFEVHDSVVVSNLISQEKFTKKKVAVNFMEIFHYAYSYIGVLTGPYYSYRTFKDYYENDFHKYIDCNGKTRKKLTLVPIYAILFLIVSHYFPIKYAESDEFYLTTNFWYRLWYITPVFIAFRMRIYVGLILSEAACIVAGLGAYPDISHPKPGLGPSENFDLVEKMKGDHSLKMKNTFNFDTVHNINIWYTETDPFMRSSIKYWNMCVQYWMAFVVYKRFPIKSLRTAATFAVSAVWHGVYAGYYLCLCSVPFYLIIEDKWKHILDKNLNRLKYKVIYVFCWIVRTQAFSYLGMAFTLLSMKNGLRYYASVYYIYHITSFVVLLVALAIKLRNGRNKKVDEASKKI